MGEEGGNSLSLPKPNTSLRENHADDTNCVGDITTGGKPFAGFGVDLVARVLENLSKRGKYAHEN